MLDTTVAQSLLPRDAPAPRVAPSASPVPPGGSIWASVACTAHLIDVGDYRLLSLDPTAFARGERAPGTTCYAHAHGRERPCSQDGYCCPMEEAARTKRPVQVQHVHSYPGGEPDSRREPRLENVLVLPLLDAAGEVSQVLHCSWDVSATEARAWAAARDGTLAQDLVAAAGAVLPLAAQSGPALTEREEHVLALVAEGLTNRAISRQLKISVSTVKYHLGHLCEKLEAGGRAELIAVAVRYELA